MDEKWNYEFPKKSEEIPLEWNDEFTNQMVNVREEFCKKLMQNKQSKKEGIIMEAKEKMILKEISDLGAGAYLMMHGYKVVGRRGKSICFEVPASDVRNLEQCTLDYLSSEYHRFDSCLMSLKKVGEYIHDRD